MSPASAHFSFPDRRVNDGCQYRELLGADASSRRLLSYLSDRYDHSSPDEWAERIAAGHVLIDSLPGHSETLLKAGSELVWNRPPWIEPEAPLAFSVLYEDADILAVNKPAGLPTLPGANFLNSTLLHLVRSYVPEAVPVHRLGRWTSGLVLCAKKKKAAAALTAQLSANKMRKRYRALASGLPGWDEKTVSAPIGFVPHAPLGLLHAATPGGKRSLSHITVLERRKDAFLCDVCISTGRPHQIRIHLAFAGYPLVGDPLYSAGGLPDPRSRAVPGDPGYHLHAAELVFNHPSDGRELAISCEPPDVLRGAVTA